MFKQMSPRHAAFAVIAAAALSLPALSSALAAERPAVRDATEQCRNRRHDFASLSEL